MNIKVMLTLAVLLLTVMVVISWHWLDSDPLELQTSSYMTTGGIRWDFPAEPFQLCCPSCGECYISRGTYNTAINPMHTVYPDPNDSRTIQSYCRTCGYPYGTDWVVELLVQE